MSMDGLTNGTLDPRFYDVPLPLGKGEVGFVKHERRIL
jgi:hypothetical protein